MIDEIRAEYLLTKLYPELDDKWVARHRGTFYRNYSPDTMNVYEGECIAELSRDGFLRLLPDNFFSSEDELVKGDAIAMLDSVKRRLHVLDEAFLPVDTQRFRNRIHLERAVAPILEMKLRYILKEYFYYDPDVETNAYIAEVAPLLPYVSVLRGDLMLVRSIIEQVTGCCVEHKIADYGSKDNTVCSMPMVIFTIKEDNLSPEEYAAKKELTDAFLHFLAERFLPCDMLYRIRVTGKNKDITLLEYNSWTTTQEYAGDQA